MKHMLRKTTSVILLIAILISVNTININAENLIDIVESQPIYQTAEEVINKYKTENTQFSVIDTTPLYDLNGQTKFTLYELSPYGYAILLNSTNALMEACYAISDNGNLLTNEDSAIIYCGPNQYLINNNNDYYNLISGDILSQENINKLSIAVNSVVSNQENYFLENISMNTVSPNVITPPGAFGETVTHTVAYDYFSNLTQYGTNVNGTCTVVAISMLLGYYDNYVNDNYVRTVFEDGVGTTEVFHQLLNNYIYDSPSEQGGIFIHDACAGTNEYLESEKFHSTLVSVNYSQYAAINAIINQLDAGYPVVASMGTHLGATYDHSVLVYRVVYDSLDPTNTAVLTMNMGWQSLNTAAFVANASWFYECGYMIDINHEFSNWIDDGDFHIRTCNMCTETQQEAHHMIGNNGETHCSECGKLGNGELIIQTIPNSYEETGG